MTNDSREATRRPIRIASDGRYYDAVLQALTCRIDSDALSSTMKFLCINDGLLERHAADAFNHVLRMMQVARAVEDVVVAETRLPVILAARAAAFVLYSKQFDMDSGELSTSDVYFEGLTAKDIFAVIEERWREQAHSLNLARVRTALTFLRRAGIVAHKSGRWRIHDRLLSL